MSIPWTKQIWPLLGAREYTSNGASIFRANCRILHRFFTTKFFVIPFPVDVVLFKFIIHLFNLIVLSLPVRWFPGDYRISLCESIKKRMWLGIGFLLLQDFELKSMRFLFLTLTTKIWWKSVLKLKYVGFWGFALYSLIFWHVPDLQWKTAPSLWLYLGAPTQASLSLTNSIVKPNNEEAVLFIFSSLLSPVDGLI